MRTTTVEHGGGRRAVVVEGIEKEQACPDCRVLSGAVHAPGHSTQEPSTGCPPMPTSRRCGWLAAVDPAVAGIIGTLLGGFIGAGATIWQASKQRKWQVQDFERNQAALRAAEVRARADAKADEVLDLLEDIHRLLLRSRNFQSYVWGPADEYLQPRQRLHQLDKTSQYLPEPLRQHVQLVPDVLGDADQLAAQRWVKERPREIAHRIIYAAREEVGRYLRGEPVSKELSAVQAEYRKGWQALQDDIERHIQLAIRPD